MKPLEIK